MNLITYIIAYPFIWLISRLNFSTIYLISDFLYYVLYYVFSYRKSVVRENLKLAFPKMSKKHSGMLEEYRGTSGRKSENVRKSFENMCENTPTKFREHLAMVPKPPGNTPGTGPKKFKKIEKNKSNKRDPK